MVGQKKYIIITGSETHLDRFIRYIFNPIKSPFN